jgi:hypothetical protein
MGNIKLCKGCKYLWASRGLCTLPSHIEVDKYTGEKWQAGMEWVEIARAEEGICGPDASRYEKPFSIWRRILFGE